MLLAVSDHCGATVFVRHSCVASYHLAYHSPPQILWGLTIGVALGSVTHTILELVPSHRTWSFVGQVRHQLLQGWIAQWVWLRDRWAVWHDGGREEEWERWLACWER